MKQSVCLVVPPSDFLIDERVFPPLGILYVAQALRLQGFEEVRVHNGSIDDIPAGYDVYAVGGTTPQFPDALRVLNHIRNTSKARVYIGGPHATVDPDSCRAFDGVVMQAGELGLRLAIEFRCKMVEAPVDHEIHPARDLINIHDYKYTIDGVSATSIMTSRGCPYQCGFCCKTRKGVKLFPAEFVLEELRELRDEWGYKAFMFFDDIFVLSKDRATVILKEIRNWGIKWRGALRADVLVRHGQEFAHLMKESGCYEIGMGVESGSNKILKIINKGETTDTIKKAIAMLKEAKIRVKGFFIVGLPSESYSTIQETIRFIEETQPDDFDFTILHPYKKSHIYENKHLYDINWDKLELKDSWYKGKPGEYKSFVWTSQLSKHELVEARDMLEKRFKRWACVA